MPSQLFSCQAQNEILEGYVKSRMGYAGPQVGSSYHIITQLL